MNQPGHIAFYWDPRGHDDVTRFHRSTFRALLAAGHRITSVCSSEPDALSLGRSLSVIPLGRFHKPTRDAVQPPSVVEIERFLERLRPDVVLFGDASPLDHLAAKVAALRRGLRCVFLEALSSPVSPARLSACHTALSDVFRAAHTVLVFSHDGAALLRLLVGIPEERLQVAYRGGAAAAFRPVNMATRRRLRAAAGVPDDAVLSLTVAPLEATQGYPRQLEAIDSLRQSSVWSRLHFVWLGSGPLLSHLTTTVERLGVQDRVHLLGERWDALDWLDAADLFVLSCEAEPLTWAVVSAMAKGLPVAVSAVNGLPEYLGDTGRLLSSPSAAAQEATAALAEVIAAWGADETLRRAAGAACWARAAALFSPGHAEAQVRRAVDRALRPAGDNA